MEVLCWTGGIIAVLCTVPFVVFVSIRLGVFAAIVARYRAEKFLKKEESRGKDQE